MYTLLRAFSLRLVFPSFVVFSRKLWPGKFRKKTHFTHDTGKEKETNRDRHFFVVVRYVSIYYVIHTRARVFVSLFDINERAIAFILSSLARSACARSRFHRSERVGKIIIFLLSFCARVLRAPKKKSPTKTLVCESWSFFFYNY
jgi:hypothetical protein